MKARIICLIPGILLFAQAYASEPVRGFVIDETSGEPLPVANVTVKGTTRGSTTNLDGFFVIPGLAAGDYTLHVSYLSYHPRDVEVTVDGGPVEPIQIELIPGSVQLEEVTYTVDKDDDEELRESPRVSTVPVDGSTIRQLPSLGAEMDVLRALQSMPGVKASSELSSALHVRGASPDMTLILMDQSTVYNPSHLFGLFSTFNADAVKHIELIKGGFPAEYGGRAGSVLEVVTNEGNRREHEGLVMVGLVSARAAYEAPLPDERGSFAASYRRTYFEPVISALRNSSPEFEDLPSYYFYDGNGKVNFDLARNTTLTIGGYLGKDVFTAEFGAEDARLEISSHWGNRTATGRLRHVLSKTSFLTVGYAWSRYSSGAEFWDLDEQGGDDNLLQDFSNRFEDHSLRADWEVLGFKHHKLKTGIQLNRYASETVNRTEDLVYANIDAENSIAAWYIQDQWRFHPMFEIEPGVRLYHIDGYDRVVADPRVAFVYHYSPEMRFKLAAGQYHQFVNLITAMDALSFFDIWVPYDGTVDPTWMNQYVAGWEYDFHPDYELTTEAYYNDMRKLLEYDDLIDEGHSYDDAFLEGDGYSYGLELMLRKKNGRLTGWLGYSLSWSRRHFPGTWLNRGRWYAPKWDRRHDFIGVATYRVNERWNLSAQWRYNTGQGYTRGVGVVTFREGPIDTGYEYNDGRGVLYGERNNYRYPADHRLDISADYHHHLFGLPAKLTLSIYNVYSRRAFWRRSFNTYENPIEASDLKLLPILPLASYEVRF